MKFKGPILFSLLAVILFVAAYFPQVDSSEKEAVLIQTLVRGLDRYHYQPQQLNDDFSRRMYDQYLDDLDPGHRFFTQEDFKEMAKYRNKLDDEAQAGTLDFFTLSMDKLEASLDMTQKWYREILAKPFDFSVKESVDLKDRDEPFAKDKKDLKEYWRKYLKYETLNRYTEELEKQQKAGEEAENKSPEVIEEEARAEVLDMFDKWYARLHKLKREDRLGQYLNTFTSLFDPHTNYLKPIDKENFDIRFSGRLEGIGARLMSDGDYTKVSEIIVGGPAWKGEELEENDIITAVAQGDDEAIDIKGMVLDDVVQKIRGKKGTEVRLTVKKVDGTMTEVSIIRDIVIIDERFAKSLILKGEEEGQRIGYLYLPSFYADFNDRNGRFCSIDVEKEIEKLKADNVDGIILDLRNNGGGSLRDVVKMSGFFVEKGPIVQVKSRENQPEVLSDSDNSVQYDGPLLVMVNNFSASASEILAAALQDYGRAVIVGSKSTFGKGTVQRFIDLDRTIRGFDNVKPLGEVKLTTQKFYRINGTTTQLEGVVPDIILPDNYQFIQTGEKEEEYPLQSDKIPAVNYQQNVYQVDFLDELRRRSESRIAQNATWSKITNNARRLEAQREDNTVPLELEAYTAREKGMQEEAKQYKEMFKKEVNDGVFNLEVDLPTIHADESKEARNDNWVKSVRKDIYINECLKIMADMLALK